jgi:hypothetical protein
MSTQAKRKIAPSKPRATRSHISDTLLNPRGHGEVAKAKAIKGKMIKNVMCSFMGIPITLPIFKEEAISFEYNPTKYISL